MKYLAKIRLWRKWIRKSRWRLTREKTSMGHSIQWITTSWRPLVWFMGVYHLSTYIVIVMLALLLSIFMGTIKKKLQTAPNRELSWSSPAFWLQVPMQSVCWFSWFSQATQYLESKWAISVTPPCAASAHRQYPSFITNSSSLAQHFQLAAR